ncbi:MAG: glycosyltransferase [Candidatus Omnitrophica bacterium]|nr:glycosyltransferase [Candidatus Omnitrophota bacterium]MDD5236202.1 glycosyltransferase [Candidatus Omnitrophota bacterium]MDD5610167.1 glycosyltransferase [Candidatus Omnitrophota bacterium]
MTLPSVSIIIPTLNAGRTISECLSSISSQDYPKDKIEIIIIDGGSTDPTLELARGFGCIIIKDESLRNNPEARKAMGLERAGNDLAAFIDSDNILPHQGWLKSMVTPLLEDSEIIAVSPLRYHYDKNYSLLNRYFALFGVNDPIAYYFNKRDRLSWAEDKWNMLGEAIDKGGYFSVRFRKDKLPTLGANGFIIRKDILKKARVSPQEFFHIDVNYDLVSLGFDKYAAIKGDIIHLSADNFFSFLKKRLRFMELYHQKDYSLRRYRLYEPRDKLKLCLFVIFSITFIKPLYDSIRGFSRVRDSAWFLHPLMCFAILVTYGVATVENTILPSNRPKQAKDPQVRKATMVAFMNSFSQGLSGGDLVFIETFLRVADCDKVVVTSLLGKELCESKGLSARYLVTSKEKAFRNVIFTYILRTLKALFLKLDSGNSKILYASSDFLPDVLPSFWQKIKDRDACWVQKIYHLIPAKRLVPNFAQRLSFALIRRWADLVIVDNYLLKNALIQRGFKEGSVKVNYPGIDTTYFKTIGPLAKHYDAVFLGRLHPSKGIFDLIEIWGRVCQQRPDSRLVIVGTGDPRIKQELMVKINGLDLTKKVELAGFLQNKDAFQTMKASRIFVFPSHEEGFGIAVLEAMACGLPVVAWDLPVFREVFPEGMVRVGMGDTDKFAEEVLRLLKDEGAYAELASQAKEVSSRYEWDKVARKELDMIYA